MDAILSRPSFIERMAVQERISKRGPLEFAVINGPLPVGVVAEIRLGQSAPHERYAIVSAPRFDDEVMLNALGAASVFESAHEDDDS